MSEWQDNEIKEQGQWWKMIELLEKLAPKECIGTSYTDETVMHCIFCNEILLDNKESHKPDCPWVEARKLLEELK